ncbi:MAG: hypothetical protein NWF10_05125 [Candidatus Bathyarchaeota archaeon]|nr:hypothetical protein [Candidatus Bathyarchaeota archaeon]
MSENNHNVDANGFMLEEYKQIVGVCVNLSKQKTEMSRFYLMLVTIPITLIAAIVGLQNTPIDFFNLPDLVVLLLIAISIAGLITSAIIVDLRFESIFYYKTLNLIRRFFIDQNETEKLKLKEYARLPDGDDYPKFYEQPFKFKEKGKWEFGVGATFLEVILMGLLNSTYFASAILNLEISYNIITPTISCIIVWAIFFFVHVGGYYFVSTQKDKDWIVWKKKRNFNLKSLRLTK